MSKDYKKLYEDALENLKRIKYANKNNNELVNFIEYNYPELKEKESEDERISKDIIWCIKHSGIKDTNPINPYVTTIVKDALDWLEKKAEQKPTEYTLKDAATIFLNALSKTPYNNKPITDAQVITKELLEFLSNGYSYNPNAINE